MRSRLPRSAVGLVAAAFFGYWTLLVYCEVWRPEPPGISLAFGPGRMHVLDVVPGGPAELAGLRRGDRILAVDDHPISGRLDALAVVANFDIGRPQRLTFERNALQSSITITPTKGSWRSWRSQDGPTILIIRIVQMITLLLALVVAMKRPRDRVALVGALFLATMGVFSVTLPFGFAAVWRALPLVVGAPLWLPFLSSVVIGGWLFSFFAIFLRVRFRTLRAWLLVWLPIVPGLAAYGVYAYHVVVLGRPGPNLAFWPMGLLVANVAYVVAGLTALIRNYRRSTDVTERRRVRVLLVGTLVGSFAGSPVVLAYWRNSTLNLNRSFLASPVTMAATFLFLIMPLSFAYAILRHRLFDVSVMIRQGVRYALARRALLALMPALLVALLLDLLAHGDEPVGQVVQRRVWVYASVMALALVARSQRRSWLDALDRRFFRERYNAQRVLREVAADIRQAASLERIAPTFVSRIEQALHPTFVALLVRGPDGRGYRTLAASPRGDAPDVIDDDNKVVALARLLGTPVEITGSETGWLARKVPLDQIQDIHAAGIDLLVPVVSKPGLADALIALGPRRSEEPYSDDDGDLLMAVAESVAERLPGDPTAKEKPDFFEECPACGRCYEAGTARCRLEDEALTPTTTPRLIAGRYRAERRLGRGGMGTVYAARDTALERHVAVKVVRPELIGLAGAAERFQREARAAAAFAHPNVVTVHDFGVSGTTAFLVMELLDGRTLHEALRVEQRLDPAKALRVLRDVVAAVEAAHRRQLIHRDLKPENIYLVPGEDGEGAKVLDFGIAKFVGTDPADAAGAQASVGSLLGTPRYMAPEQLRGEAPTFGWDLWALAVVAFEMLTGSHPFASIELVAAGGPRGGAMVAPSIPLVRPAQEFFSRALAIDPAARPPSARAFLSDLENSLLS